MEFSFESLRVLLQLDVGLLHRGHVSVGCCELLLRGGAFSCELVIFVAQVLVLPLTLSDLCVFSLQIFAHLQGCFLILGNLNFLRFELLSKLFDFLLAKSYVAVLPLLVSAFEQLFLLKQLLE